MFALVIYGFILGHIAIGAIVGFCLGVYVFRPSRLVDIGKIFGMDEDDSPGLIIGIGIAIAAPTIGVTSYSLTGSDFLHGALGKSGESFWIWVLVAAVAGLLMGAFFREGEK